VTHTDWLPGLLVLGLGLVAAVVVLVLSRRRAPQAGAEARRLAAAKASEDADLRSRRLFEQLRELEADRHQLSDAAYQEENARLEQLAAKALRDRDEARALSAKGGRPASALAADAPQTFFGRHPQLVGALWGAGAMAFFGALALWLSQDVKPRAEGETATGTAGRGEPSPPANDTAFQQALEHARANPGDAQTSVHVVHELIRRQDYQEARELTEKSLGVDPFLGEARVHRAFLRAVFGDEAGAARELQRVSNLYPNAYEGFLFLGMMSMRSGDNRAALDAFDRFLAEAPPEEQPPQMRAALNSLRQQLQSRQ
jgi:tetratricopeptide (TPR) repeat protein